MLQLVNKILILTHKFGDYDLNDQTKKEIAAVCSLPILFLLHQTIGSDA